MYKVDPTLGTKIGINLIYLHILTPATIVNLKIIKLSLQVLWSHNPILFHGLNYNILCFIT